MRPPPVVRTSRPLRTRSLPVLIPSDIAPPRRSRDFYRGIPVFRSPHRSERQGRGASPPDGNGTSGSPNRPPDRTPAISASPPSRPRPLAGSRPSADKRTIRIWPGIWPGIWLLAATHLAAFADRFLIALVAPAMKADLRLSDLEVGLLQGTAFVAVFVVASALCGGLVDRAHRPRLVCASILVWSLACLICGLATSLGEMAVGRMVLGLGQACLTPAALSLIAARQTRGQLGRGVSLYTAGATLGRSSALLLGGGLLAILPATLHDIPLLGDLPAWRVVFLLSCLPNLVLGALFLCMPDPEHTAGRARGRPPGRVTPWLARHAGRYAAHSVAAAATVLIVQSINAWTVVLYVRRFGLTLAEAGSVLGLVVVLGAPAGHLTGGWIIDRLARHHARSAAALVLAGCLAVTPVFAAVFSLSDHLGLSLGGLAVLVFVLGLAAPAGLVGLQAMTPRPLRGRMTAVFVALVTATGFGLGPPLIGLLSDRVFGESGLGQACITVVTGAAILGLVGAILGLAGAQAGPRGRRGPEPT